MTTGESLNGTDPSAQEVASCPLTAHSEEDMRLEESAWNVQMMASEVYEDALARVDTARAKVSDWRRELRLAKVALKRAEGALSRTESFYNQVRAEIDERQNGDSLPPHSEESL